MYEFLDINPPKYVKVLMDLKNNHTSESRISDHDTTYITVFYNKRTYFRIAYMKRANELTIVHESENYINMMSKYFTNFKKYEHFTESYILEYLEFERIKR
jgi:hypothetical protein